MSIQRAGGGSRRVVTQPVEKPVVAGPQKAQAHKTVTAVQDEPRRKRTREDRHGAASRAFDDPAAQALRARLSGPAEVPGFGVNATDRPLRTLPGVPTPATWHNPGAAILGQLTVHPPEGPLHHGEAMARTSAACVLAWAAMGGAELTASVLARVGQAAVGTCLSPEDRQALARVASQVPPGRASLTSLWLAQGLMARAADLSRPLQDALQEALRPPQLSRLGRDEQQDLRIFDRRLRQAASLDQAQSTRLANLLSVALDAPFMVVLAWDVDHAPAATRRPHRLLPAASVTPEEGAVFSDGLVTLVGLAGVAAGPPEPVKTKAHPEEVSRVLNDKLDRLAPSEGLVVPVHASDRPDDTEMDRHVLLGRRKDGTAYLYNPDPRDGDFTLVMGRAGKNQGPDFTAQVLAYSQRVGRDRDGTRPVAARLKAPAR
jgi:hypothetical protein